MRVELTGDWKKAKRILAAAPHELDQAIEKSLAAEGEFLRGQMVRRVTRGLMPPLSSSTLLTKKKGTKPLIKDGDLVGAFSSIPSKKEVFIGVPRSAPGSVYGLMHIHEFGRVIVQRMTDKQRRFLHAVLPQTGYTSGSPVIVIHIPPRPVIRPVFAEQQAQIGPRLAKRIASNVPSLRRGNV